MDTPSAQSPDKGLILVGAPLPAAANPALRYIASLESPVSQSTQRGALRMILRAVTPPRTADEPDETDQQRAKRLAITIESFPWHMLRVEHTDWILTEISKKGYKPATRRCLTSALRGVMHASRKLKHITADELLDALGTPKVRAQSQPTGREIKSADVDKLFDKCRETSTIHETRSIAALALLFGGGLRRAEVVSVNIDDINFGEHTVGVLGKGSKYRDVPIGDWVDEVREWIKIRGSAPGPLICRLDRWGNIYPSRRITPSQLYSFLEELATAAVVDFRPHDARRTLLTDLLRKGVDMVFVQKIAGHKSSDTTAKYDMRGRDEMISARESAGRVGRSKKK